MSEVGENVGGSSHHATCLVPPISESHELKRKLSLTSSCDEEYEPNGDLASLDDESSIQMEEDEKDEEEINDLKKEGDLPLEELMDMYGINNNGHHAFEKFKEENRDSASESGDNTDLSRRMSMYDKEDWKKDICVGPEYQAVIPSLLIKDGVSEEEEKDTLLWQPDKLKCEELNRYLAQVYAREELPVAAALRDDEEALYILHSNDYQVQSALEKTHSQAESTGNHSNAIVNHENRSVSHTTLNDPNIRPTMQPWTEEECQGFETGLKLYGKQFHLIQKKLIPSRKVSEVVQFYYLWKKTERYDLFIQYYRLGSSRYIFNPGQPLDRSIYCSLDMPSGELRNEDSLLDEEEEEGDCNEDEGTILSLSEESVRRSESDGEKLTAPEPT